MGILKDYKEYRLIKYYTKHCFPTINPETFLCSIYANLYDNNGNEKLDLSRCAKKMIAIAERMKKYSDFCEAVSDDAPKESIDNDLKFFELTKMFWNVYYDAEDCYKENILDNKKTFIDKNANKHERAQCHYDMIVWMSERDMINRAVDASEERRMLLTENEKKCLLNRRMSSSGVEYFDHDDFN